MELLRLDLARKTITSEELPETWKILGGSGLIAKIMNHEVPPEADPLGPQNKLIIAAGPLAGTMAPQLGRISVGAKSPLTYGIKEANAGGPAAQKLDRLGYRALVVEGTAENGKMHILKISKDEAVLLPADHYTGMKTYELVRALHNEFGSKPAIICIGIGGEREYLGASVSFTDVFGDPSRNAARGGLGAVMGAKGLKAIVVDASGAPPVHIADPVRFKTAVKSWINTIKHDVACGLFSKYGTPFAVAMTSSVGSMPANNYRSGRAAEFQAVSGEAIQKKLFERGGTMHGCMPGCVVRCSIVYPDADGKWLASAYEYEAIALLGTNLGITDLDAIGRLKFMCDDLGIDVIETGSSLGVAAEAGKMSFGDAEGAMKLLREIEQGTDFGHILGNGVVRTANALHITRIPAFRGQAIPGHDPRAVKGTGVTYFTSPMGADHTAGLTYRTPQSSGQKANSLRAQVQAAVCDTFNYCINSVPGGQASLYAFLAELMNARYGLDLAEEDIIEIGKETLRDQLKYNEGTEFHTMHDQAPNFVRSEALFPTGSVMDVDDSELKSFWKGLDTYKERKKVWEVRFPTVPQVLFGAGVIARLGERIRGLRMEKALLIADQIMTEMGRTREVQEDLQRNGISTIVFSDVEPDPPVELVEKVGKIFTRNECRGIVAMGGGSSLDLCKATAIRVSQLGDLTEYESIVGGTAKITPPVPPVVCIPTTSGTGSEVNQYAVITDKSRDAKFMLLSDLIIPRLAVIDPDLCKTMPPRLTVETGIDALAHCIEGYVGLIHPYHPYYESLALFGTKLIGRSLRRVYANGEDMAARTDMCMAAMYGGLAFSKGLGIGHAITHALGSHYHVPHGRAAMLGLLCFVRGNKHFCGETFSDLAWALDRSDDLEGSLLKLYRDMDISTNLSELGVLEKDLKKIAFYASKDAVNMATNPAPISERRILELLEGLYV